MKLLVKLLAHRQMFGLAVGVLRRKFAAGSKESVSMVVLFPLDKALSHPQGLHVQMMYRVRERERKNFTERKKKGKGKTTKTEARTHGSCLQQITLLGMHAVSLDSQARHHTHLH